MDLLAEPRFVLSFGWVRLHKRLGDLPEFVIGQSTGLVNAREPSKFAATTAMALQDNGLLACLGQSTRQLAEATCEWRPLSTGLADF